MDAVIQTLIWQMVGYMIAMGFSFVLMNFWQRGYFWAYVRVRTSLDKLILVKMINVSKIVYKIGRIEDGNLLWGKQGKDGRILMDIKRDYIYREQNVNCVDVDAITFAFIPKEVHYAKPLSIPDNATPENYAKVFRKDGNEVIVTAIEGFDPGKIDSFVQAAQFRPSEINKTMMLLVYMMIAMLIIGAAGTMAGFIAGDAVKKADGHIGAVEGKVDKIVKFIEPPQVDGVVQPS